MLQVVLGHSEPHKATAATSATSIVIAVVVTAAAAAAATTTAAAAVLAPPSKSAESATVFVTRHITGATLDKMAAVIKRARGFAAASPSRLAIVEPLGSHRTTTYKQLVDRSASLAAQIMPFVKPDVHGRQPRIAHLCPRDSSYVVAQWAAWQAGTINVPMAEKTSQAEWEHVLKDSAPAALLVHKSMAPTVCCLLACT